MKKLAMLAAAAVSLWAADFWVAKPYTDWSMKEAQKIIGDSPWARRTDVPLEVRMPPASSQSDRGRGGRGGGGDIGSADGGLSGGAGLAGGRGGPGGAAPNDGPMTQTASVLLIWQTALPVKQALAKAKYGAEAGTSAEAKAFLEREEQYFVLNMSGLPANLARAAEGDNKAGLLKLTSLSVKGKDPVAAMDVQISKREKAVDAMFVFPRMMPGSPAPFSVDDRELEFSTKFDKTPVRYRFKLKDMVYHGKLEL